MKLVYWKLVPRLLPSQATVRGHNMAWSEMRSPITKCIAKCNSDYETLSRTQDYYHHTMIDAGENPTLHGNPSIM